MVFKKSCGFVVYMEHQGIRKYLVIHSTNRDYGFPKGHVECNETEYETAIRELKEETNLEVQIIDGFRRQIEYKLPYSVNEMKQSVYFLGRCTENNIVCQKAEVLEAMFVPIEQALTLLSFEETKTILKEADDYVASISPI